MAAVNVTFPGNLAQVETAQDLRALPSALSANGDLYLVSELKGVFEYDPGSLSSDNNVDVVRPNDKTILQAGRWLRSANGLAPGAPGAAGPANSTYQSLAALKAAPGSNGSYLLTGPSGLTSYAYVAGDFTIQADDINVVKLNAVPLTTGALVRSQGDVVNVRGFPFYAAGDGVTNDTAAIQSAIDFVSSTGGGTVWIPAGIFGVRLRSGAEAGISGPYLTSLVMRSNVSLKGPGTIKLLANDPFIGPGSPMRLLGSDGVLENVTIEDVTFDYSLSQQSGYTGASVGDRANGGTILLGTTMQVGCTVRNIHINRVRVKDGFAQAIQIVAHPATIGQNVSVTDCVVESASYIGIQFSHIQGAKITGNDVSYCLDNGIDFYGDDGTNVSTGKASVVSGNRIRFCLRGIFPETYAFAIVAQNLIDSCEDAAIHVNRIVGAPVGMVVESNIIINTPIGVRATGEVAGIIIRNNEIAKFGIAGIQLGDVNLSVSYVLAHGNLMMPIDKTVALVAIAAGTIGANFLNFGTNYLLSADSSDPTPQGSWFVDFSGMGPRIGNRLPVFIGFSEIAAPDQISRWTQSARLEVSGNATIGALVVSGGTRNNGLFVHGTPPAPLTATSSGETGEQRWDDSYFYVCIGANTWKRTALTTW